MGSRKSHAAFLRTWLGEAAIMVSTSTFSLKNRFIPRTRGRARTRAARDFLKAIVAMLVLKTNDALISKRKIWGCFYTFFCERFVVRVLTLRRQQGTITIKTPLHSLHSSIENSNCWSRGNTNTLVEKQDVIRTQKSGPLLITVLLECAWVVWRNGIASDYSADFLARLVWKRVKAGAVINVSADMNSSRLQTQVVGSNPVRNRGEVQVQRALRNMFLIPNTVSCPHRIFWLNRRLGWSLSIVFIDFEHSFSRTTGQRQAAAKKEDLSK